jgi:hypothetical protein
MPTQKTSGDLISLISEELADNNAGLISALDVRHNMEDTVRSGPYIMALSNTEDTFYFRNNVLVSGDADSITPGTAKYFITQGGISFPNTPLAGSSYSLDNNTQVEPYPGAGNLQHNDLAGLSVGNPHTQYLLRIGGSGDGMLGNLRMTQNGQDPHWIGPSGLENEGLAFDYDSNNKVVINTSGAIVFPDGSKIANASGDATAKGLARAWCNFDASGVAGTPVIRSSYNIHSLERTSQGKLVITFASGTFADNNYVAIGSANATTDNASDEDFDLNTVGLVLRQGDDGTTLRTVSYVIRNDNGEYVDAEVCDFVAYGLGPDTSADPTPTVS